LQRPFGAAADLGRGDILGYEEAAGPLGSGGFFSYRGPHRLFPHHWVMTLVGKAFLIGSLAGDGNGG